MRIYVFSLCHYVVDDPSEKPDDLLSYLEENWDGVHSLRNPRGFEVKYPLSLPWSITGKGAPPQVSDEAAFLSSAS